MEFGFYQKEGVVGEFVKEILEQYCNLTQIGTFQLQQKEGHISSTSLYM
jgi:hypothetical protein